VIAKRKMLVTMATGTGKTLTVVNETYRLMKSGAAPPETQRGRETYLLSSCASTSPLEAAARVRCAPQGAHLGEEQRVRQDAPVNKIKLAVARALIATMDEGRWRELALLVDDEAIVDHPRLLRSLYWQDSDYTPNVYAVLPRVLGVTTSDEDPFTPQRGEPRLTHLAVVEEFLDLGSWLAEHEPDLHHALYGDDAGRLLPDLEAHAELLDLDEARDQVRRLRRDLSEDLPAAIGQAKELVETVCKAILGLHGAGPETQVDMPELVKKVLLRLQLHPTQVNPAREGASDVRRVLQAVSHLLGATAPYRNLFGTGHGRSGGPRVDDAAGRFMVRAALDAVTFLLDVHQVWQEQFRRSRVESLSAGDRVIHLTFGEGSVVDVAGTGDSAEATITFADSTKRLMLRYAPMALVP